MNQHVCKYTTIFQGFVLMSPIVAWPADFVGMIRHNIDGGTLLFTNKKHQIHREDGPAVIWPSMLSYGRWYLNSNEYSNLDEYIEALNKIRPRTPEEIENIKKQWK